MGGRRSVCETWIGQTRPIGGGGGGGEGAERAVGPKLVGRLSNQFTKFQCVDYARYGSVML